MSNALITVPQLFGTENAYVEGMTQHVSLNSSMEGSFVLEAPSAASTTNLLEDKAITAGERIDFEVARSTGEGFGRTIQVTCVGAGTLTVYGVDYLNQQMSQTLTLVAGTAQTTLKAFKKITAIESGTAAGDVDLGLGEAFGLPFTALTITAWYTDKTIRTTGTLVGPVRTDPATAITGDPRGTFLPTGQLANGVRNYQFTVRFSTFDEDYGLYGVKQV